LPSPRQVGDKMLNEIRGLAPRIRKYEDIIFHHKSHREHREKLKIRLLWTHWSFWFSYNWQKYL